uniref:PGG domain-containing protein n=1 Tax=Leersia perrieri TaxID=77586 RepID=A0A0D9WPG8_9ORYZ
MGSESQLDGQVSSTAAPPPPVKEDDSLEWQLRKYLLLLAILVATVTYIAGLDPPGGVWMETKDGHLTGNPILPDTRHLRYMLFYYFNATAFAASLVLIIILLSFRVEGPQVKAVRWVMVVDLLCLMVAYVTGSCRGRLTTIFSSLLSAAVFAYVVIHTLVAPAPKSTTSKKEEDAVPVTPPEWDGLLNLKERRKVLMLLAIFVVTITYTAGLSPPGGTWEHAEEGSHQRAGDPVLLEGQHHRRFIAFFIFNTLAFVASLAVIMLLLSSRLASNAKRLSALFVGIALALLGLMGAYASGSCRETDTTVYVLCLTGAVASVLIYICCLAVIKARNEQLKLLREAHSQRSQKGEDNFNQEKNGEEGEAPPQQSQKGEEHFRQEKNGEEEEEHQETNGEDDTIKKALSLILLLATLTATVTYQAGMDPPGGVWRDNDNGHNGGDLILPATHPMRHKVFFYCNSVAFVASIVVVIMVQSSSLINRHALEAAVILDLFGLMGAYAAGSCRDVHTSIYIFVLAAAIFVLVVAIYAMIHKFWNPNRRKNLANQQKDQSKLEEGNNIPNLHEDESKLEEGKIKLDKQKRKLEKKRKLLLLLAILADTNTYQAGLTPPGGFWIEHADEGHHYGDSILADNYPRRYKAFFYCNATSFMASVVAIVLLVSRKLSDIAIGYYRALYVCMAVGLVGLMGAYAAGTTRRLRTSIYVIALVGGVLIFAALHIHFVHVQLHYVHVQLQTWFPKLFGSPRSSDEGSSSSSKTGSESTQKEATDEKRVYTEKYKMRKYLMLLGILAASVTYQAGLAPPGSVWPTDDGEGHMAGDPILKDIDVRRYHVFFYSNSTSFVASLIVIVLLLQGIGTLPKIYSNPLKTMHAVIVLDLLGLLVAYAAGSSREWGTSGYVVAMAVMALSYVVIYVFLSLRDKGGSKKKALGELDLSSSVADNT